MLFEVVFRVLLDPPELIGEEGVFGGGDPGLDDAVRILDDESRIAMLSFSSFGSGGSDASIDKIKDAIFNAYDKLLEEEGNQAEPTTEE